MITVAVMGGLGNQMFQYAAGRALALRHRTALALDLDWFAGNKDRRYRLDALALADEPEAVRLIRPRRLPMPLRGGSRPAARRRRELTDEDVAARPSAWDEAPDGSRLRGYWQDERYFRPHAPVLRRELVTTTRPSGRAAAALARIDATTTVAVHVRRGDYVTNPAASATHGLCSLEYYEKAMELMDRRLGAPHFAVFSDDPEWAERHLAGARVFILPPEDDVQDLHLMSRCHSHVIANSSFSWWGAWLAESAEQLVVAPRPWFRAAVPERGIVPDRWTRLAR